MNSSFLRPVRSWRAPSVRGISTRMMKMDPAFDIDGLPDPFSVYWPALVTNLYDQTIYVTALLRSPPAGWTDAEQNITAISVGGNVRVEKSNTTRAVMAVPHNELITLRWNYRTGGYGGPVIGYDDFQFAIYWESIGAGTVDDTDDFEADYDGWTRTAVSGYTNWTRGTLHAAHGAMGLHCYTHLGGVHYIRKTVSIGAGTRAYLFGYILFDDFATPTPLPHHRVTIIGPIETLDIVYLPQDTWRRWGIRLNPGESNEVTIYMRNLWGHPYENSAVWLDYFRWVRY